MGAVATCEFSEYLAFLSTLRQNPKTCNCALFPPFAGMVKGIAQSAALLLVLTKGALERPFVHFELRTAVLLRKKIIMVHEDDHRRPSFASFDEYFRGCPADLRFLKDDVESRGSFARPSDALCVRAHVTTITEPRRAATCVLLPAIRRKGYEQEAMLVDILRECRRELAAAAAARRPMQVLEAGAAAALLAVRQGATLFVDLGTGQSVVYLLALNRDGSLDYQVRSGTTTPIGQNAGGLTGAIPVSVDGARNYLWVQITFRRRSTRSPAASWTETSPRSSGGRTPWTPSSRASPRCGSASRRWDRTSRASTRCV